MVWLDEYDNWKALALTAGSLGVGVWRFAWRRRRGSLPRRGAFRFARFIGGLVAANTLLRIERLERAAQEVELQALRKENQLLTRSRFGGGNGWDSGSRERTRRPFRNDPTKQSDDSGV